VQTYDVVSDGLHTHTLYGVWVGYPGRQMVDLEGKLFKTSEIDN